MNDTTDTIPAWFILVLLFILAFAAVPSPEIPVAYRFGRTAMTAALLVLSGCFLYLFRQNTLRAYVATIWARGYNRILLGWLAFILVVDVFAADPSTALFGSEWWGFGFFTQALCVLVFFVGQLATLGDREWRWLSWGLCAMLVLTLVEAASFRPLFWLPTATLYPATTIGQFGHLAGLFIVAAGLALYRRAFPSLLMAVIGIAVCKNASALIAYQVVALGLLVMGRTMPRRQLLIASVVSIVSFLYLPNLMDRLCFCKQVTAVKNVSQQVSSGRTRLLIWESALSAIRERPLTGWGDEHFTNVWHPFLPTPRVEQLARVLLHIPATSTIIVGAPDFQVISASGERSTPRLVNFRPHNAILEELVSHGSVGLALLLSALWGIVRRRPLLFIPIATYGIYLLTWFTLFHVTPIFLVLLGILLGEAGHGTTNDITVKERRMP